MSTLWLATLRVWSPTSKLTLFCTARGRGPHALNAREPDSLWSVRARPPHALPSERARRRQPPGRSAPILVGCDGEDAREGGEERRRLAYYNRCIDRKDR